VTVNLEQIYTAGRPGSILFVVWSLRAGESTRQYIKQAVVVGGIRREEPAVGVGRCGRIPPGGTTSSELTWTQAEQLVGIVRVLRVGCKQRFHRLLLCIHRHIPPFTSHIQQTNLYILKIFPQDISYERWNNKLPFDSILSQQHLCQRLPKSIDVHWSYSVQLQCRLKKKTLCI